MSIITVGFNPTLQKTLVFPSLVPDAVNRCAGYRLDTAGKALNVSRVLSQLGKKSIHLTQLGGRHRPVFLELCAKDGIDIRWAESESEIRFCYTLLDREKHQFTELVEEGDRAGEGAEAGLLEIFNSLLPDASALIIAGSKTSGFSDRIIPEMVKLAKAAALRIILDIRGADLLNSLPYRPDIIKPNADEFASTFAHGDAKEFSRNKEKTAAQCRAIWESYGCNTILTRGGGGVWYAEAGNFAEFGIDSAQAVNTTGSGDAFTAGLVSALSDGALFKEALAEGARCGRLNALCLKPGTIVDI